ncbi:hypothetical protein [Tepidibacillus fermentans]|uniref:Uncharacterized protein n=1 Tax=Tepidibacillus fermentans TaxID=1281767 RepID=A0A4R3K9B7_9BACI|nr:hypothetical protein [Tepidibacillus fermentans]TCS79547.1 hypothetical protein EDD72_1205 [Tepidibacillus fermentans]
MERNEKRVVCDLPWCKLILWFDENMVPMVELIDKKDPTHNVQTTALWFVEEFLTSYAFILTNIPEISKFRGIVLQGREVLEEYYDGLSVDDEE